MADERAERIALNESRFRKINDKLRDDLAKLPTEPDVISFVCECGSNSCEGIIEATLADYEAVRASSRRFLVLPEHNIVGVEQVVDSAPGHMVVEKNADVGSLVDASDPRRDQH